VLWLWMNPYALMRSVPSGGLSVAARWWTSAVSVLSLAIPSWMDCRYRSVRCPCVRSKYCPPLDCDW
tara:strand:- start:34859 stop:35059 length:201 start_codon:yes stop_codon:yes gene_type:complete